MAGLKFDITGNANGYIAATRQAEAATGRLVGSLKEEGQKIDDLFKKLATSAGTVFTLQMASQFSQQVAKVRGEFQQLEVAFETMLQSKEKADALMAQVVETAATTPFDLQGVANGAKQLLAYGVASEQVNDTLIRLGDIAAGLSIPLNDLVYLYGTTMVQGRLFTQDLRQFQGRGIPLADELAKQFGVAKDAVGELVTAGKVGFPEVEKAIMSMTSEGGKFAGLMEKQSKTITGQISNLEDAIDQMFNEIGKSQEGVISGAIELASDLVENYEKMGTVIGGIVVAYGSYKAALIALNAITKASIALDTASAVAKRLSAKATKEVTVATLLFAKAQKALSASMLANPYVLAAAAIAALGVGIYALVTAKSKEERAFERVNEQIERYDENLSKQKQHLQELFDKLNSSESTDMQRALAMEQLRELYPTILKDLSDEELLKMSAAEATKKLTEENEKLIRQDLAAQIAKASQGYEEAMKKILEYKNKSKDAVVKSYEKDSGYIQATKDAESYRYELEALLNAYNDIEEAAKKADFLALPTEQKIVSLKESNEQLDADIKVLDMKLKELKEKKYSIGIIEPDEFKIGSLGGALYEGGMTEDQLVAEIERLQALKKANEKDIAENQAKVDAENKVLTDKQKKAAYDREKAEQKAAEDLAKMKQDLNNKIAQADINSLEDGYAKSMRQLKHNHDLELQEIERQKKELRKRKKEEALQSWLAEDPENRKAYDFKYTATLTSEEEEMFRKAGEFAQKEFNKGREQAFKKWQKESGFFTRQLAIDAMAEGSGKDEAQRELDNDREIHNLELQRDAYLEAAEAAHIFAENEKKIADLDYVIEPFDKEAANAAFDNIVSGTRDRQLQDEQDRINDLILQYGSYEEKKSVIQEKYAKARVGVSAKEAELLTKAEAQELYNLEQQYKRTASAIQDLFGNLEKKSSSELNAIADKGASALEYIKTGTWSADNKFGLSEEAFNEIKADPSKLLDIANAIEQIRRQADDLEGPLKRISEGFKELFESQKGTQAFENAFSKISSGFSDVSNAFGFVSDSLSSMGEALGNEGLAKAAEGINSALNVAGQTMEGAQAGAAFGPWGAALGAVVGLASSLVTEISKAKDAVHQAEIDRLAEDVAKIDADYENLGKSIEKAYSVDASELIRQQNILLEQKKSNLELMIAEEKAKKNVDSDQVKQWEDEINGIETSIEDNAEKAQDAITGISFDSFRDNFLSSLMDMESGTEEFASSIEETIREAMYNALIADKYQSQLESLYDDLAEAVESGSASEIAKVKAQINDIYGKMEDEARLIDERIGYDAGSSRSATSKGIAQASQSSVDELNGRMTAIQSHTFSINQHLASVVAINAQILGRVSSIDAKASRLEEIERNLTNMRSDISDMLTRGIKVKA